MVVPDTVNSIIPLMPSRKDKSEWLCRRGEHPNSEIMSHNAASHADLTNSIDSSLIPPSKSTRKKMTLCSSRDCPASTGTHVVHMHHRDLLKTIGICNVYDSRLIGVKALGGSWNWPIDRHPRCVSPKSGILLHNY